MEVTFRGVRGSFPVCHSPGARYGGNTSCLEIAADSSRILIDAGTGIRAVGKALVAAEIHEIHLLLSHTHWDHIQGFPHFAPLYEEGVRIWIYSLGRSSQSLRDTLSQQQDSSYFPISLDKIEAEVTCVELIDGQSFAIGDAQILCRRLNHPGVTGGFRVEQNGSAIAYISDVDYRTDLLLGEEMSTHSVADRQEKLRELRAGVRELAHGTDLMVFDTFFLPDEYEPDWGHSCPDDAVNVGLEAGVARIALFHHKPHRSDDAMDAIVAEYRQAIGDRAELLGASEGLHLTL